MKKCDNQDGGEPAGLQRNNIGDGNLLGGLGSCDGARQFEVQSMQINKFNFGYDGMEVEIQLATAEEDSLLRAGWCEEGHPATKKSLQ